jgi:hypothetical protein
MLLIKLLFELIINVCLILLKSVMKIDHKHTYKSSGNAYPKVNEEIRK